jgi:LCP family protein required for cell wall assembly
MARLIGLAAILFAGWLLLRPVSASGGDWPVRLPAAVERGGKVTVLALGLDRRGTEPPRTDAILLLQIGPPGRPAAALSIPRDLWVSIPDQGDDRINTAYTWGDLKSRDGLSWARRTVERSFEVRVDRVVSVDFACFRNAVDAAGGVGVDVATRIVDHAYPGDEGGVTTVAFEPGRQTLSGERALQYVRTRSADSDFGRMGRQQQVVAALAQRMRDPAAAARVGQALLQECPGLATDLSPADILLLAGMAANGGDVRMGIIGESMVSPTTIPSGAQVLLPRWERIRPMMAELFSLYP